MSNNHEPVTKLSSIGKGFDQDLANLRYIARFGTMMNERDEPVAREDARTELKKSYRDHALHKKKKTSFRTITSLPLQGTDEAREIVLAEYRQRYGSFFYAYHEKNDKGEFQPHLHITVLNDREHHPLRRWEEIKKLRKEIGQKFAAAGISFSPKKNPDFNKSQAAIHAKDRREIEEEMQASFSASLYYSRDIQDFTAALQREGLSISRETKQGLITLANEQGYRMRLENISDGKMKTRKDLERYFYIKKEGINMEEKELQKLMEAEQAFARAFARRAAVLAAEGKTAEQIRDLMKPANPTLTRLEHIRREREHLQRVMSPEKLGQKEKTLAAQGRLISPAQLQALTEAPEHVKALAAGEAMPLIKSIISITASLAAACKTSADKGLPPRGFSPSGIIPGAGKDKETIHPARNSEFAGDERLDALERLIVFAQRPYGSTPFFVRSFLCHLYNPEYPLDLTAVLTRDKDIAEDALRVMRMRSEDNIEPHMFFDNGDDIFEKIHALNGPMPSPAGPRR